MKTDLEKGDQLGTLLAILVIAVVAVVAAVARMGVGVMDALGYESAWPTPPTLDVRLLLATGAITGPHRAERRPLMWRLRGWLVSILLKGST